MIDLKKDGKYILTNSSTPRNLKNNNIIINPTIDPLFHPEYKKM